MQKSKKWGIFTLSTIAVSFFAIQTADAATYTVQKGDTLTKIANHHQITVDDIKKWNKLTKDTIYVDQKLQLTDKESIETTKPVYKTHTVVKGDTLSKIARHYNVTIKDIKTWNALENDSIFVGQVLKLSSVADKDQGDTKPTNGNVHSENVAPVITKDPTATGQAIYKKSIEIANTLIGTPYLYGGNTSEGLDCSGFIYLTFNEGGLKIGRDSSEGYFNGNTTQVKNPVPGDLVFFENTYKEGISHMGIYLGDNKFIHAGTEGVEVSDVTYAYWSSRVVAYKRFDLLK